MSTFSFVWCTLLLLMSGAINEFQKCKAQFLFVPPDMTTIGSATTRNKDKAVTIPPTTMPVIPQTTVSTNDSIGMETENNITLGSSGLSCSQVVNITSNITDLHFRIPRRDSTIYCVITIHGQRGQNLVLQLTNISIESGMLDCEQGSIQLYTLKDGLLYFRNKTCNSTQTQPQLATENNVAIITISVGKSMREQGFGLVVQTTNATETGYGYPNAQYGHSGTSFGLPSIAYAPTATYEPPSFTYGTPSVTYRPPNSTYGPPSATYGPPRPTYGPPSATYGPPSATYGPPSATYGPPSATYGPPSATYGPPSATYGPQSATYGPPSATYGPPRPTYGPPMPTYGPPMPTYGPPMPTYGPPSATYGPPSATYGPPSTTHGLPSTTYGPPNATNSPPPVTYGPSVPGYPLPTYNRSSFLSYFIGEHQNLGDSIDRDYSPGSGYGYEPSSPPTYGSYPTQPSPPPHGGYGYHCNNDCDKTPWKVTVSESQQSETNYSPQSSPLYAWLTSGTKPKYWSNELLH